MHDQQITVAAYTGQLPVSRNTINSMNHDLQLEPVTTDEKMESAIITHFLKCAIFLLMAAIAKLANGNFNKHILG